MNKNKVNLCILFSLRCVLKNKKAKNTELHGKFKTERFSSNGKMKSSNT